MRQVFANDELCERENDLYLKMFLTKLKRLNRVYIPALISTQLSTNEGARCI